MRRVVLRPLANGPMTLTRDPRPNGALDAIVFSVELLEEKPIF